MGEVKSVVNGKLRDRFDRARGRSCRPVREIAEGVRERLGNVRGSSEASIRAYVRGIVRRPRPEILKAAAEVLGVDPHWLITGDGEMTAIGAEAKAIAREETSPRDEGGTLSFPWIQPRAPAAPFSTEGVGLFSGPAGQELFVELVYRLVLAHPPAEPKPTEQEIRDLASHLRFFLEVVWDLLGGPDSTDRVHSFRECQDAFLGLLSAMVTAVTDPGLGHTVAFVSKTFRKIGPKYPDILIKIIDAPDKGPGDTP